MKTITQEDVDAFREEIAECLGEDGTGSFSLCAIDLFDEEDAEGEPIWECFAENHQPEGKKDIFELFGEFENEFLIEQDGYEDFLISRV